MGDGFVVAVAQPRVVAGDLVANAEAHAAAIRAAAARLVVFPELSLTGYELDADPVALDDPCWAPIAGACAAAGATALVGAPVAAPGGGRHLAVVAVDAERVDPAYAKVHLGGDEVGRFVAGDRPGVVGVDGRRVGVGTCKDTGVDAHVEAMAALELDAYVAGLCHHDHELAEQDHRGVRLAAACGAPVAFASFAGPTGFGYTTTAGTSTIWSAAGAVLARAGAAPGEVVRAAIT